MVGVVAWVVVGIVIGWVARPVMYPTIASVVYERAGGVIEDGVPGESALFSGSGNGTYQAAYSGSSQTTGSMPSVLIPSILQLIEQQKVKQTLDVLQKNDLYLTDNHDVGLAFRNNLHQLHEQQNWRILSQWVRSFLEAGHTDSILHSMDASIKRHQGDLFAATHALFLAKYYGESDVERANAQIDIENLIINMMNQYRENSSRVSRHEALKVMQVAIEKQPENPLFGLEVAMLYADAGDAGLAIETLNFIPYSEKYQDAVQSIEIL